MVSYANDIINRQLAELEAIHFTGKIVLHMAGGIVRKAVIEATMFDGSGQRFILVPAAGQRGRSPQDGPPGRL
jgi:hypothetical protein